jgi:hypothetical protein
MQDSMITTALTLPGDRVLRNLGVGTAVVVERDRA